MPAHPQPGVPVLVLDTNAALDWLVFRDPGVMPLAAAIQAGQVLWIACPAMREELAHMLHHGSLARWEPDAVQALQLFDSHARVLPLPGPAPATEPGRRLQCTDRDDQMFIDLAIAHAARWLVTRDRALLNLARRARLLGVAVLRPVDWRPASLGSAHHLEVEAALALSTESCRSL